MNRHVAVGIVGFRNPDDIAVCLETLQRSTHTDYSIVICENGGDAAYEALSRRLPRQLPGGQPITILNPGENLGYAGGVNRCIEAAGHNFLALWVLNPDTEPRPDALQALLRRLDKGDVEAVGAVILSTTGIVQAYGGRWRSWLAVGGSIGLFSHEDDPVDAAKIETEQAYLIGASMLVSRVFIDQVGPMREDYFLYVEEIEWFLRARRKGIGLGFAPDAFVVHHQGTTTGWAGPFRSRPKLSIYLDARNRVRLTAQMMPWFLPTALCGILLHALWRYGKVGAWRQIGFVIEGLWAGIRGESGRPSWVK